MAEERIKRRRLPSRQACLGCRKRKHRCDGERPQCGNCRSRWITCEYVSDATLPLSLAQVPKIANSPGQGSASEVRDVAPSLATEKELSQHATSISLPSLSLNTEANTQDTVWVSSTHLSGVARGTPLPGRALFQSGSVELVTADQRHSNSRASSPSDSGGPDGYFGDSSTFAFVSKVQPESKNETGVHLRNARPRKSSISNFVTNAEDNAETSPAFNEADYKLPDRQLADSLVDGYFERVHPLYPFVHETSFRADYERVWTRSSVSALRPSWYALLNIIFALGCEFCDAFQDGEVMATVRPFVTRSRNIIFSHVFKKGNLELIQSLLLMSHYLQGTLELNECWNLVGLMIRTAFTIGLHLNPEVFSLKAIEIEVRKRVWWGCVIIDRTLSMKFGRPTSIQAADVYDVPYPLSVDDQYIHDDSLTPRQPAGNPSNTAFFIHTIELSKVIDGILRDLYGTNRRAPRQDTGLFESISQYQFISRAVMLDGQLRAWWKDAPAHLQPDAIPDGRTFKRQQMVMRVRYLQIRILLQRQLFLMFSRQNIEDHFLRSIAIAGSQTCIYAARETVKIIHSHYHCGHLNSLWYNLHYIFTSMGVLLHVQSMDKQRLEMLGIQPDIETLDCGMEFLRSAANTSSLAAKYVMMLQHVRNRTKTDNANNGSMLGLDSQMSNLNTPHMQPLSSEQLQLQAQELRNPLGDIDLDGMNFDDFLLGTGLPQDVLSFEYPNSGFFL
ncbi:fungal-specific transcription factor domain-containing protein [Xylogone sp. PMI_703]|nr:fungal-specific transcription factor domain-containing protein [Xylogone sp. PMI_703]